MIHQLSRFSGSELRYPAVEHRIDILAGQARGMEQAVDIGVSRVNRFGKCTPRRVIPGMDHIGRGADPGAPVPAKVQQGQHRSGLRRDTHPDPLRDLLQPDLTFSLPVNLSLTTVSIKAVAKSGDA